jgi:hypothetical protein
MSLSAEQIAKWRTEHYMIQINDAFDGLLVNAEEDLLNDPHCAWCCENWPCPVSQLLDEVDRLRALEGER